MLSCGSRMRLPIPPTWETAVALKGNKPETWEELLDGNNLPYMALLRNLRNLLIAGLKPSYVKMVVGKVRARARVSRRGESSFDTHCGQPRDPLPQLASEYQVIHSRQFPSRFLAAYTALEEALSDAAKRAERAAKPAAAAKTAPSTRGGKKKAAAVPAADVVRD